MLDLGVEASPPKTGLIFPDRPRNDGRSWTFCEISCQEVVGKLAVAFPKPWPCQQRVVVKFGLAETEVTVTVSPGMLPFEKTLVCGL